MSAFVIRSGPTRVEEFLRAGHKDATSAEQITINTCVTMSSELWLGFIDGEPVCAFGLIPPSLLSKEAHLWLYCTPKVEQHKFLFVRRSQVVVEELLKTYDTLVGYVIRDNVSARRWLEWLGATFKEHSDTKLSFEIGKRQHG